MIIAAGELIEVLTILPSAVLSDDAGAPVESNDPGFVVRGKLKDIKIEARMAAGEQQDIGDVQFLVFYDERITLTCKLKHRDTIYDITAIQRMGYRKGLILLCKERRRVVAI